jgi:hypothetical protein
LVSSSSFSFSLFLSFTPQLCSFVSPLCMWYIYYGVVLGYSSPPPFLFWSYVFISHKLYFLLCLATAPVKISSLMECLPSKLGKKLPLLRNYTEQHRSHLLHSRSLKSHNLLYNYVI